MLLLLSDFYYYHLHYYTNFINYEYSSNINNELFINGSICYDT